MRDTIFAILVIGLLLSATGAWARPSYVGSEECKTCHADEFGDWQRSKHARVFELLQPGERSGAKKKASLDPDKDYTTDRKCLQCHTTGFGEGGGFEDKQSTPSMSGLGCEACHGPGSEYRKLHKSKRLDFTRQEAQAAGQLYGSLDPGVCKRCHGHKDNPFVPSLDPKYTDDIDKLMKKSRRAFHEFYPLDGKH